MIFDDGDPWLTDRDIGKLLHNHPDTVSRWRRYEGLPYLPGRPARTRYSDLIKWLDKRKKIQHASPGQTSDRSGKSVGQSNITATTEAAPSPQVSRTLAASLRRKFSQRNLRTKAQQ